MSNINILSLIFFLLFSFSFCTSPFNEMSDDSLKEFIDDSETCLDISSVADCIATGSSLKKKGDVESKCCAMNIKDTDDTEDSFWCVNLSNDNQVKNYFLNYLSYGDGVSVHYSCDSQNLEEFKKKETLEYELINSDIASGQSKETKDECLALGAGFKHADGCCYVDGKCLCFSEGVSKNEMDILLMMVEQYSDDDSKTIDQIKAETFYCKDKLGDTSGTYKELFGSGEIMKFNGIFGLLLMFINFIL